jgi:hypothetical protein
VDRHRDDSDAAQVQPDDDVLVELAADVAANRQGLRLPPTMTDPPADVSMLPVTSSVPRFRPTDRESLAFVVRFPPTCTVFASRPMTKRPSSASARSPATDRVSVRSRSMLSTAHSK